MNSSTDYDDKMPQVPSMCKSVGQSSLESSGY